MNKHGASVVVVFGGLSFRRYPESLRNDHRNYFKCGRLRLHRVIWESVHGKIPPGLVVHHLDGNPLNNAIENLAAISHRAHAAEHIEEHRRAIAAAIRAAPKWHRSEEGRKWHAENGKRTMRLRPLVSLRCRQCESAFRSKDPKAMFCGGRCLQRHSRINGKHDVESVCAECGCVYSRFKYQKTQTICTKSCARRRDARLRLEAKWT